MTVKDIAKLGKLLARFLAGFACCFARPQGRALLAVYVRGLLSDVQRKNAEAIALDQKVAPRTLQRFLESIVWDEQMLRDRCQQMIAIEHAKSRSDRLHRRNRNGQERQRDGRCQTTVQRQSREDRKLHQQRCFGLFRSRIRLSVGRSTVPPQGVDRGTSAPKKTHIPDEVDFKTKPQIALDLIDRAKSNGIEVMAWTADELYGRDGPFLDGLDERGEAFVVEIPPNAHVWLTKPKVLKKPPQNRTGRPKKYPRLRKREQKPSEVQNLAKYSPAFHEQTPQRYRIKDTHRGSEVWEIRWHTCWRKTHTDKLVSKQCTLIVARNVLTDETKYFLSNRVPRSRRLVASQRSCVSPSDVGPSKTAFEKQKRSLVWITSNVAVGDASIAIFT